MKKLVLIVIDGMRPLSMAQAIAAGGAPVMARLLRDGFGVDNCVSSFPSLTPVATSTIVTGQTVDAHHVPSMNWYSRPEQRYIDYGTSLPAARRAGVISVLRDLVYRLNEEHLSRETPTFFETLEAADVSCACTTYMVYRGPHRHEHTGTGAAGLLAQATGLGRPGFGPSQLIYADVFDSLGTPCRSRYGLPGLRDQQGSCAGIHLVQDGSFDFMLLSLPDNDHLSHRGGPDSQVTSIARADAEIAKVFDAGGGYDEFLQDHAVIVVSDHSHSHVSAGLDVIGSLRDWNILEPRQKQKKPAELAVCPAARFASVHLLQERNRAAARERLTAQLRKTAQVDQVMWLDGEEAAIATAVGELRFAPGSTLQDGRGNSWDVEGDLSTVDLRAADGLAVMKRYPDALGRIWAALHTPHIGDVLLTPELGTEFLDWGGVHHAGGGTHGSLHREDSNAQLIVTGTGEEREHQSAWSIADVHSLVLEHFGV
ncbi:MAG: alkaline phosphatase family protein [Thermoleophilaceae bacterium]|nr:alkaline phosphatase family protein [Thermoleophilaceae bacterium]